MSGFDRQPDLLRITIEAHDLHVDFIADVDHRADARHAVRRQFADVTKAFDTGGQSNESTELGGTSDFALVD